MLKHSSFIFEQECEDISSEVDSKMRATVNTLFQAVIDTGHQVADRVSNTPRRWMWSIEVSEEITESSDSVLIKAQ